MDPEQIADPGHPARPPYRPPIGVPAPLPTRRGWLGTLASVALHALALFLLLTPLLASDTVRDRVLGAGDSGPAGGGGGGNRGRGRFVGATESLRYVDVSPAAATPAAPVVVPPAPTPKPAVTPPPVVPPPPVRQAPAAVPTPVTPVAPPGPTASAGIGDSGTGTDGSAGTGPGSGGGVGSGVGTGQGSGIGPGRGGDGVGGIFLPEPTETILPPFDAPGSVRGQEIVVTFDIDERGRIVSVSFPPTRDGGYNRKLRERLESYRFRPGHTADGQPVRAKFQLSIFIS